MLLSFLALKAKKYIILYMIYSGPVNVVPYLLSTIQPRTITKQQLEYNADNIKYDNVVQLTLIPYAIHN